jgi:hypothetical protein
MKRIELSHQDLLDARERILAGEWFKTLAEELGVSIHCLRQNFRRSGMEVLTGKEGRARTLENVEAQLSRREREEKYTGAWDLQMSSQKLREPLICRA